MIEDAEQDILDLYTYISQSDSPEKAQHVIGKIKEISSSLKNHPNRGHFPRELERIGIMEYREIHFKPYRIIYRIAGNEVYIHCILDSRRDLQELLEKRLLRP